ncbi:MAG TPA: UDP-N-acetylmuramate--L-alanine ligase, partial [Candidatus Hydrogenedentes bacterium]|nr:UDP-N-acetylmuramate--L-alanine ligase [Candidatus Hydrogenedentota bacterium]
QPHLFSRTKFFCEQFAEVLARADRAIVTDIYPSREEPMPGVSSGLIVDAARAQGAQNVQLINDMFSVPGLIAGELQPDDLVLILGAGNINQLAGPLLQEIARRP